MNTPVDPPAGPLRGVRVVNFAPLYQGPYASMVLADLGADVIVVERPDGDQARRLGHMFDALNRGKRSITLDLKDPTGRDTARRLAATADVLFEAFRPGTMDRFGLGYEQLAAGHPGLVYVSISGFGQDGPYRDRAGHDLMYQAVSGMLASAYDRSDPVVPPPDLEAGAIVGALYAALGALAGLAGRTITGHGTYLDLSTHEALMSALTLRFEPVLNSDDPVRPAGPEPGYAMYRCADGKLIALGIGYEDHFWRALCVVTGLTRSAQLTQAQRLAQAEVLSHDLADALSRRDRASWQDLFDRAGVPAAPVHRLPDALSDPHVRARQSAAVLAGSAHRYVRSPLRLAGYPVHDPAPAPRVGEHTAALLHELAHRGGDDR